MSQQARSSFVPGLALVAAVTLAATLLGRVLPLVGDAVLGILLGIAVHRYFPRLAGPRSQPGIRLAASHLLPGSVVVLGFCLPIAEVAKTGLNSLSVTLATIAAAYGSAIVFGALLRVPLRLGTLIATGTAICGGSAIAAVAPVVKSDAHETAFSLSTIFLFNIAAVLLFPPIGHWLGLSARGFGLWAGTAINDTSSVVAAAYAWSREAGEYATIVKLTRATLIIPVTLAIGGIFAFIQRRQGGFAAANLYRAIPWFIVCFVAASACGRFLPPWVADTARWLAPLTITGALTAIGLTTDLGKLRQAGWRPVALGLLVWLSVAGCSLLVQSLTARW